MSERIRQSKLYREKKLELNESYSVQSASKLSKGSPNRLYKKMEQAAKLREDEIQKEKEL